MRRPRAGRLTVGSWSDRGAKGLLHGSQQIVQLEDRPHGRSGVPLYLWYAPGKEAEILPQILTTGTVTALAR